MPIRAYHDFVIFVYNLERDEDGDPGQFTVRVFSSPVGEGEREETVTIQDYPRLKLRARELERRELEIGAGGQVDRLEVDRNRERQMDLGDQLGRLLLPDYARAMFWRSLDWLQRNEGLRLRLRLPSELSDLPWEFIYLQRHEGERNPSNFAALHPQISIVRHEALAIPALWFPPGENRRLIVAMATPEPFEDYPRLEDLPAEQQLIREALARAAGVEARYVPNLGGWVAGSVIPGAQPHQLTTELQEGADIFHFSGHGEFPKRLAPSGEDIIGEGAIILASEYNRAVPVPADRLLEMVRHCGIRLVVLGACETARSDAFHVWSSVAASLLKGEIPAVVAMQFTVYSHLTALFMGAFYEALAGGLTIDEAVYLGRRKIRDHTLLDRPDVRDWGAPVLYLRTPGGQIFNPVGDEEAREQAERRSNGRYQVHQLGYRWIDRRGTASPAELRDLEKGSEELDLEPIQALLLLRSAVAADEPERPWLDQLQGEGGNRLMGQLDDPAGPRPDRPEEAVTALGLEPETLAGRPEGVGWVAWAAASHPEGVTRRTAALALSALKPSPQEGRKRLEPALAAVEGGRRRRNRRAELFGALADADPQAAELNREMNCLDRLQVWGWRVGRRALRDGPRQRIVAQTLGGVAGAGLALGVWRGLIALVGWSEWPAYFNVNLYLGAFLGLFVSLGMSLAEPTLLYRREEKPAPVAVARRAAVLGLLFFGVGHFLEALLNNLRLTVRPLMPLTGLVAGAGLMAALYDQPRAGRRLGVGGWFLRLGGAGVAFALAQLIVVWLGGDYPATAISQESHYYWQFFRRYDAIRLWMDHTTAWETTVMMVDTTLVGVVLALGMTWGLAAAPRWLAWWWRQVGRAPELKELMGDLSKEGV
jgi:hypothetical protein